MSELGSKRPAPEEEKDELVAVSAISLQGMIRSKLDLYNFISFKIQRLLPKPFKLLNFVRSRFELTFLNLPITAHRIPLQLAQTSKIHLKPCG